MRGYGFYAIIVVLLVITVSVLLQQNDTTTVTYAQVVDAFENKQVTEFVIKDSSLEATLKDGKKMSYELPSVELFFKWIKQHLKIKKFWGTSENAIGIQIYCAIITYCLVAIVLSTKHCKSSASH